MREGWAVGSGCRGDIGLRVDQRGGEQPIRVGRQLALHVAPGHRGGDSVGLVEDARDGIGPVRIEVDGLVVARPQEEEAQLLRRQHLGDVVRGGAPPLGGGHLAAADVQELVDHVQRRLALEHLPGDRLRAVARAALGAEILPVRLDGHAEQAPLRRPVDVEGQLGAAAEGRDVAGMAAADGPGHQVGTALVVDPLPVPAGDDGGPNPAAVLADDRQRVPLVGMPDVGHASVDVAHDFGAVERHADVSVHLAGGVDLAHPVDAIRPDPEALERVQEEPGEVARVRVVAVAGRIRHVSQRAAHGRLHGIGRQQGLGIHRVQVVDAVEVGGLQCRRRGWRGR